MVAQLERVGVKDQDLRIVQDSLLAVLNPALRTEILNGETLGPLALTTSFQNFAHGLGRPARWIVSDIDASATVWRDSDANNPDPTRFVRLRASAAANVKLWVF